MKHKEVEDEREKDNKGENDPVVDLRLQNGSPRVKQEWKVYSVRARAQTDCFQCLIVAGERTLPDNPYWWTVVKRRSCGSLNELPAL
jgi:hypothetical protein